MLHLSRYPALNSKLLFFQINYPLWFVWKKNAIFSDHEVSRAQKYEHNFPLLSSIGLSNTSAPFGNQIPNQKPRFAPSKILFLVRTHKQGHKLLMKAFAYNLLFFFPCERCSYCDFSTTAVEPKENETEQDKGTRGVWSLFSNGTMIHREGHGKFGKNRKPFAFEIFNYKLSKQTKNLKNCAWTLPSNHFFTCIYQKHLYPWFGLAQNLIFEHLIFNPCDTNLKNVRNCCCSIWFPKGA